MSDTQWPRYEVFVQERPGRPHQHAGSVHAPDPEMALLNARDVFVRRPECASLWVAPSATVRGGTAEELSQPLAAPVSEEGNPDIEYLVFAKLEERGTLAHVGEVHATGPEGALAAAKAAASRPPLALWVIPATRVERTLPEEAASMFDPSRHKPFRDQAFYHIQTALRRLRRDPSPVASLQTRGTKH
jgi:ring-1,2-phenylacetyl-CoA epoxidase subunit PaaB